MSIYVITGTTGIAQPPREKMQEQGHEVFNIDYKGGRLYCRLIHKRRTKRSHRSSISRYPDESTVYQQCRRWSYRTGRNPFFIKITLLPPNLRKDYSLY